MKGIVILGASLLATTSGLNLRQSYGGMPGYNGYSMPYYYNPFGSFYNPFAGYGYGYQMPQPAPASIPVPQHQPSTTPVIKDSAAVLITGKGTSTPLSLVPPTTPTPTPMPMPSQQPPQAMPSYPGMGLPMGMPMPMNNDLMNIFGVFGAPSGRMLTSIEDQMAPLLKNIQNIANMANTTHGNSTVITNTTKLDQQGNSTTSTPPIDTHIPLTPGNTTTSIDIPHPQNNTTIAAPVSTVTPVEANTTANVVLPEIDSTHASSNSTNCTTPTPIPSKPAASLH